MKVYVIGDFGLDTYHIGTVRGISAEVPIPILDLTEEATLPGMAGNVAANLYALGMDVVPFQPQAMTVATACPVKHRLVTDAGQQLARWDVRDTCPAYTRAELAGLRHADAVVVADYGKGSITPEVVEVLSGLTVPTFVDTKQNPAPWIGCKEVLLFPNLAEYKAHKEQYDWVEKVVLKLGPQGIAYLEYGKVVLTRPSYAFGVQCVNGAGDTALSAFVCASLAGLPLPQCLEFASSAAANVVEQHFLERTTDVEDVVGRLVMQENESAETSPTGLTELQQGRFAGWAASYTEGQDASEGKCTCGEDGCEDEAGEDAPPPSQKRLAYPGKPQPEVTAQKEVRRDSEDVDYFRYFRQIGDDTRPN